MRWIFLSGKNTCLANYIKRHSGLSYAANYQAVVVISGPLKIHVYSAKTCHITLHFSNGNKEYLSDIASPCIYFCFF